MLSKITDHKLSGSNYLDWSKTIRLFLRSIDKDDHLTDTAPSNESKQAWLREDARLFLQIRNSIDSEIMLGILAHEKIFVLLAEIINKIKFFIYHLYELKAIVS